MKHKERDEGESNVLHVSLAFLVKILEPCTSASREGGIKS